MPVNPPVSTISMTDCAPTKSSCLKNSLKRTGGRKNHATLSVKKRSICPGISKIPRPLLSSENTKDPIKAKNRMSADSSDKDDHRVWTSADYEESLQLSLTSSPRVDLDPNRARTLLSWTQLVGHHIIMLCLTGWLAARWSVYSNPAVQRMSISL